MARFRRRVQLSRNVDGIILSWNKAAERLFGYLAEEGIGKPLTITVPPGREDEYYAILEGARRGDHVQHHEIVRQSKDGSLIDISLTVSPIRRAGGKVVGISNIARDITERKAHEEHVHLLMSEVNHRATNMLNVVPLMCKPRRCAPDPAKTSWRCRPSSRTRRARAGVKSHEGVTVLTEDAYLRYLASR